MVIVKEYRGTKFELFCKIHNTLKNKHICQNPFYSIYKHMTYYSKHHICNYLRDLIHISVLTKNIENDDNINNKSYILYCHSLKIPAPKLQFRSLMLLFNRSFTIA